ncbi:MAG: sigma-54 interaction domain-containing protein, partial [Victivallaceae bacterium]
KGLFIPVHCAALAANLLECELFGHEKGAFTGAAEMRRGRFELADGGTLFLDEIGEIELSVQVKLLRVLETRTIERVGGHEPIACDARLVAATHRDLGEMVKAGTFREDLYYRLGGIQLTMPPLRDRKEDIPALAERFMAQAAEENNRQVGAIAPEALAALVNYSWPGNIRELRHCIERMVVLARGSRLEIGDVPDKILHGESAVPAIRPVYPVVAAPAAPTLEARERELIMDALKRCAGNRTLAARELGISRRTLHRRLKEYEMETKPGKEV